LTNFDEQKIVLETEIKIQENELDFVNFIGQGITDEKNDRIFCKTDQRKISELKISTGELLTVFELTDSVVAIHHQKIKNRNPNLEFMDSEIDTNSRFTASFNRFWYDYDLDELIVAFTFQFRIIGSLDNEESIIWAFFTDICKLKNGKVQEIYHLSDIQDTKTHYSSKDDTYPSYYSGEKGLYFSKNKFICGVNNHKINDSSNLLAALEFRDNKVVINEFLPVFPNQEIHRRKDYIFTSFTFVEKNDNLYFTDCRSLFNLKTNKRTDLITDKVWSVIDFKFLDDNHILSYQKCDTSKQNEIGIYKLKNNQSSFTSLKKFDDTFFAFGEKIYEIKKVKDTYFLRTYTLK